VPDDENELLKLAGQALYYLDYNATLIASKIGLLFSENQPNEDD